MAGSTGLLLCEQTRSVAGSEATLYLVSRSRHRGDSEGKLGVSFCDVTAPVRPSVDRGHARRRRSKQSAVELLQRPDIIASSANRTERRRRNFFTPRTTGITTPQTI